MAVRLVLVVALAVVASACTTESDSTTTVPATLTTTSSTSTTTVPATTTTTEAPTTTTTEPSTTTTEATTTTTTTLPAVLELSDEGIQAGATWTPFGTTEDDAIAAVSTILGAPTDDSGWVDSFSVYGTCPPPVVRGVHWGAFVMLLTQAETDFWSAGVPHFFAWYYTDVPPDIATTEGLVLGDTLGTLEALYGGPLLVIDEDPFDPSGGIWSYDLQSWTGLSGFADGQDPSSTITSINGGRGCGE